jgi:hypothetical protein
MEITIVFSDEEWKAMSAILVSPEQWVNDVAKNKAKQCIDRVISEYTDRQPNKLVPEDKQSMIANIKLSTRAEKEAARAIITQEESINSRR